MTELWRIKKITHTDNFFYFAFRESTNNAKISWFYLIPINTMMKAYYVVKYKINHFIGALVIRLV